MTTRRAACSCGQLHLTIEGEPSRISMCHCLECQRRTGAVISNQARFRREQSHLRRQVHGVDAHGRERQRADLSFLSDMRLHRLLGGRRLSWIRRRCHRQLRRPEFPRADHRGVGGVTPPLGLLAARHAAQARGEAGVTKQAAVFRPSVDRRGAKASAPRLIRDVLAAELEASLNSNTGRRVCSARFAPWLVLCSSAKPQDQAQAAFDLTRQS